MITILKTCPPVDLPAFAPPCSSIAADLKCFFGSIEECWRERSDFPAGMQSEQMRNMTVFWVLLFKFFLPLQQLPFGAYLKRVEFTSFSNQQRTKYFIRSQDLGGLDTVSKQVADN